MPIQSRREDDNLLDQMTMDPAYTERPMSVDHFHLTLEEDGRQIISYGSAVCASREMMAHRDIVIVNREAGNATSSGVLDPTERPVWLRLQFDCAAGNYETELLPDNLHIVTEGLKLEAEVVGVTLSIVKAYPDGEQRVEQTKTFTAEDWDEFVEVTDLTTFYGECTKSGNFDIARAMTLAQRKLMNTPPLRSARPR